MSRGKITFFQNFFKKNRGGGRVRSIKWGILTHWGGLKWLCLPKEWEFGQWLLMKIKLFYKKYFHFYEK